MFYFSGACFKHEQKLSGSSYKLEPAMGGYKLEPAMGGYKLEPAIGDASPCVSTDG